jgi:hypothetical protein
MEFAMGLKLFAVAMLIAEKVVVAEEVEEIAEEVGAVVVLQIVMEKIAGVMVAVELVAVVARGTNAIVPEVVFL